MSDLSTTDIIILAGGLGTRLASILPDQPKILAPIGGGRTYLDFLLQWLKKQGGKRLIFALGHKAGAVMDYLQAHPPAGMDIAFSQENSPLGTGGALRLAAGQVRSETFLAMNGDSWVDADLNTFLKIPPAPFSLLCVRVPDTSRFGTVDIDNGVITGFAEKNAARGGAGIISAGIYRFDARGLDALQAMQGPSLEKDFFEKRLDLRPTAQVVDSAFIDIGTPESLEKTPFILA
jgi:NDP-sugar pyrophosphorylase family protein